MPKVGDVIHTTGRDLTQREVAMLMSVNRRLGRATPPSRASAERARIMVAKYEREHGKIVTTPTARRKHYA